MSYSSKKLQGISVKCQSNNTACDLHGDSLIDSFGNIESILECRQLCYETGLVMNKIQII